MTSTATRSRSATVWTTIGALSFLGISAMAGGVALVGGDFVPPVSWLDDIPLVDSWVVPGLVLGIGFGLGSLVTAYGVLRRPRLGALAFVERWTGHHWSWITTILIGAGHVVWIVLELIYLPQLSLLQAVYGAVGLTLVSLPLHPHVRRYLAA